jgi:hypothetical protein
VGYRLSPDHDRITILLPAFDAREVLSHVASNGRIAVIWALPATHQALQLKGADAKVEKPGKADLKLATSYCKAFVDHLARLGYSRAVFEALLNCQPSDLAAVSFSPLAAFSQTPGPGAGFAIGAGR